MDVTNLPYHLIVIDPLSARLNTIEVMWDMSLMLGTLFPHSSAFVKQLVEDLDLFDLECKLGMFRVRLSFLVPSTVVLFVLLNERITSREHYAEIFTV